MQTLRNAIASSIVLCCVLMLCCAVGCSKRSNDDAISSDIQRKITTDPATKDASVQVASREGKIKLTGTVHTEAAQQRLDEIAHDEPGITAVNDETKVQPPPATSATADSQPPPPPAPVPAAAAPTPAPAAPPTVPAEKAAATPVPEKPKPQPIVVPAGRTLTVRTTTALSSKTSQAGQTFVGVLADSVSVGGRPALPKGATVSGRVISAKARGKIKGEGELSLELSSITVGGRTYEINSSTWDSTMSGKGKRTAVTTGGGAAGGALIGGLAGHGKGALIGGVLGAGAGLAGGALTGNKQVELPSESIVSFTLTSALTLPPRED